MYTVDDDTIVCLAKNICSIYRELSSQPVCTDCLVSSKMPFKADITGHPVYEKTFGITYNILFKWQMCSDTKV
jgi:hypothetical protein